MTHVTQITPDQSVAAALAVEVSRRQVVTQTGLWAAVAALASQALPGTAATAEAQDATPVADPDHIQQVTDLSKTLCGGGNFDPDRAAMLAQFLTADADLTAGLAELIATPPVDGGSLGSPQAETTAKAILIYWYVGAFGDAPVPNRSTVYYGLTAWQAMYTPPWAVCKAFGGWADPPRTDPLVAANS